MTTPTDDMDTHNLLTAPPPHSHATRDVRTKRERKQRLAFTNAIQSVLERAYLDDEGEPAEIVAACEGDADRSLVCLLGDREILVSVRRCRDEQQSRSDTPDHEVVVKEHAHGIQRLRGARPMVLGAYVAGLLESPKRTSNDPLCEQ